MAGELNNQVKVGRESIDGWLVLLNEEELTHWACRVIKDKPAATKPSPAEAERLLKAAERRSSALLGQVHQYQELLEQTTDKVHQAECRATTAESKLTELESALELSEQHKTQVLGNLDEVASHLVEAQTRAGKAERELGDAAREIEALKQRIAEQEEYARLPFWKKLFR